MAAISVRELDEAVASRLKLQAALHGRSMEAELGAALSGLTKSRVTRQRRRQYPLTWVPSARR